MTDTLGADTRRVLHLLEELPRLAGIDEDLVRRGRFLSAEMELGVGAQSLRVSIANGRVVAVKPGPFLLKSLDFAIRAEADVWLALLAPVPRPMFHDILALSKRGLMKIEGNLQPFMANLQYIKDLVTAPRALSSAKGS